MNSSSLGKIFSGTNLKFNLIFENLPICIHEFDLEGRFVSINRAGLKFLEAVHENEILGKSFFELLDESEVARVSKLFQQSIKEATKIEFQFKTKNNGYYKSTLVPLQNGNTEIVSLLGISENVITTTQLLLGQTTNEIKQIIDALDESSLVSVTDTKGIILKVNKRFCEIAGYDEAELLGKNHRIINSGHHSKQFWREMWQTILNGNVWRGEIRNITKDGRIYWVDSVINPVRSSEGKIYQFLSIRQDITKRKIYEQLLLQANAKLSQIQKFADLTFDAIQVASEDGRIIFLNHQASLRLGIPILGSDKFNVLDIEPFFENNGDKWADHVSMLKNKECITIESVNHNKQTQSVVPVEITARYVTIDGAGYIISISRDISERKKNEQKLREFQERLEEAQRIANLGYWEFNLITNSNWWSDEQYIINGVSKDQPISQELFLEIVHPDDRQMMIDNIQKSIQSKKGVSTTYRIIRRNDKALRYLRAISKVTLEGDRIVKLSGVNLDITESVIADSALKKSEQTLRKAQEVAKIGSWRLDIENGVLEWSDEVYHIFGVAKGTPLSYYDFLSYIHPEDKEFVDRSWQNAVAGVSPYDIVHRIIVKNKIKWVREIAELTFDKQKKLLFGFGTVQDITDQKILQDTNRIFNQIQLLTGLGSWRWSVLNNDLFWSDNIYNLLNLDPKVIQPSFESYLSAIHPFDRDRVRMANKKSLETTTPFCEDYRIQINNNEIRWLQESGDVIVNEKGKVAEMYGIIRDITHEKNSTIELIEARLKAEEASAIKDEFLSIISHEIRTPLNSVIGLTNLLLRRNPREDQHDILATLKGSADNLLHLVNDILDFNKIRAGKIELESLPLNLSDTLKHIHSSFNLQALDKGLLFRVKIDPQIPHTLLGDVTRLNQILNNLVSNAVKFTHKGFVKVEADMVMRKSNLCRISIKVEDTGIGISTDKMKSIFLPFQQSERDTSRKYGGTGLGLSIVKSLVEVMGGEIKVKSNLNEGSEFIVELDFEVPENLLSEFTDYSSRQYSKILAKVNNIESEINLLYVEDVESNRFLIENLLADYKINCTTVSSGRAALRFTKLKKFDLILMDVQMPGMDGYQTTDKIRKQTGGLNLNTPILAFTAEPQSDMLRKKVLQHRIQDVITKPFDTDFLINKIHLLTANFKQTKQSFISLEFYNTAFDKNDSSLKKIKLSLISDFRRFGNKLEQAVDRKDMKLIKTEIHRIRPIVKNVACNELLHVINELNTFEKYSVKVKNKINTATKLTQLIIASIKELS